MRTLEDIANELYMRMEELGYSKGTDKSKWHEPVMAEKLGHTAHKKISAGAGSLEYGSDAKDDSNGIYAEYKAKCIVDEELNNLFEKVKNVKSGKTFAPFTVPGIYNGAYKDDAIEKYSKIDHYFGVFYKELCVLIIKVDTDYVIETLRKGMLKMTEGKSKNLNTVKVKLSDTHLYEVAYKNETWWNENK
tara:strand:- start:61 stop:630 length:570 start_codon:yes stop_codon:yes gene_type:complete